MKEAVAEALRRSGYDVVDLGAHALYPGDDYPDLVIPLAREVAAGTVLRGLPSAAAASARQSPQIKSLVYAPDLSMTCIPRIKVSRMTT